MQLLCHIGQYTSFVCVYWIRLSHVEIVERWLCRIHTYYERLYRSHCRYCLRIFISANCIFTFGFRSFVALSFEHVQTWSHFRVITQFAFIVHLLIAWLLWAVWHGKTIFKLATEKYIYEIKRQNRWADAENGSLNPYFSPIASKCDGFCSYKNILTNCQKRWDGSTDAMCTHMDLLFMSSSTINMNFLLWKLDTKAAGKIYLNAEFLSRRQTSLVKLLSRLLFRNRKKKQNIKIELPNMASWKWSDSLSCMKITTIETKTTKRVE